jgi:hypothetical protein
MNNEIYIDENGVPVDPSLIGSEYEMANQQQEKPKVQNNFMTMKQQEERVHNFMTQTSPTGSLQDLSYVLQGYVYNESTRDWIKISDGLPDDIRLDFLQFITADLSENVRMTNLDINQINGVMVSTIEWITDYLDINADRLNLSEEQMTKIGLIMVKSVFFTLLRSQAGVERHKIFSSLNMNAEMNPQQQMPQKQKFWQFWK